jgi:hypothetical protein
VQVAGAIATVTLTAGGAGYANGTYSQQALTGGTGTGATADIVVAGGIATSCVVRSPGTGYAAADALSCATIGAGAGFVATVATIAQTVNGSGNLTALGRIGAGTATPRAALDVVGGVWVNGFEPTNAPNAYSQSTGILSFSRSFATIRAGVQTFDASVAGTSTINSVSATPILTNLAGSYQGIQISPLILSSSGSGLVTGCSFRHLRTTSGDLATPTVLGSTVNFQAVAGAASAASYNYSTINGFQFAHNFNAAGTTVDLAAFNAYPITLALGHVVTTAYGLRLQAASISGGASITNRWGISQEDTLAKNYFAGNVGIGTASPTGRLHVVGGTAAAATNGAPVTIIAQNAGTGNQNGGNIVLTPGALSGSGSAGVADLSGPTGTGLKLPSAPGNTDAQTLDCYQENPLATTAGNGWTPTLSAAATWGGTQPNVVYARYVRMGSMVFCEVNLTVAGTMTSTYGITTMSSPFATNSNATHAAVPVGSSGVYGVGFQFGATVYLPNLGGASTYILTWSFFA